MKAFSRSWLSTSRSSLSPPCTSPALPHCRSLALAFRPSPPARLAGRLQVVANFSASWCGPCRMITPYYIELSEKHPSLMFLTVDVDELTEFSTQWDIKATPTFFFLRDGEQFDKLVGANKPELLKKINGIVDSESRRHM